MLLHPVVIFLGIWSITAVCYLLRVADWMPDRPGLLLFLFGLSTVCFFAGYMLSRGRRLQDSKSLAALKISVNFRRMRLVQLGLALFVVAVTIYNTKVFGPPPGIAAIFHWPSVYYLFYGRLRALTLPAAGIICLCAMYERRLSLRLIALGFGAAVFISYMTRESFIATILEGFFLYVITRKFSDGRIVRWIGTLALGLVLLVHFMGNLRIDREAMLDSLDIRPAYRDLNTGLIWTVAYVSLPSANLLAIVDSGPGFIGSRFCLERSIPNPAREGLYDDYYMSLLPNYRCNTPTYLGMIYLDLGYGGIVLINLILGALGGLLYSLAWRKRFVMTYSIYLTILCLLFFQDYLFHFPFLVTTALSIFVCRFCLSYTPEAPVASRESRSTPSPGIARKDTSLPHRG